MLLCTKKPCSLTCKTRSSELLQLQVAWHKSSISPSQLLHYLTLWTCSQLCLRHCAVGLRTGCVHYVCIIAPWVSEPDTQLQTQSKLMLRGVSIDSRLSNTTFWVQSFKQKQTSQTSLRRPAYRVLLGKEYCLLTWSNDRYACKDW